MKIDVNDVLAWEPVIERLIDLGVKSFTVIKVAAQDAGADDATIAALEPKWDALCADVERAASSPDH